MKPSGICVNKELSCVFLKRTMSLYTKLYPPDCSHFVTVLQCYFGKMQDRMLFVLFWFHHHLFFQKAEGISMLPWLIWNSCAPVFLLLQPPKYQDYYTGMSHHTWLTTGILVTQNLLLLYSKKVVSIDSVSQEQPINQLWGSNHVTALHGEFLSNFRTL